MATLSFRQIAFIAIAAVALCALYYLSQALDMDRHIRTQQTLQNLKQRDAELKRDVLRTRTGLLNHYDTLVGTMKALRSAHARLAVGPDALPDGPGGSLKESLERLGRILEARAVDLERFKRRNAILRNSLSYLPVAAARLTDRPAEAPGTERLAADMSWVLRDVLVYNLSGDPDLRNDLLRAIKALETAALAASDSPRADIENILAHVATVLAEKPALDSLVAGILASDSAVRIDDVTQRYSEVFAELESRAGMYRSLLFALAVLTVLYVAFILMRLNRAAASLESANVELEERVEARTAELVETNRSLQVHLDRIGLAMERAEKGDLDIHLPEDADGVYAILYRRFNHMIDGIRDEAQILKVAQELSGELKLDALLAQIMRTTTDLLDADRSTIFVHDPASDELWSRVAEGVDVKEIRIPDDAGIAGKVFSTGEPENVTDPYSHALFNASVDKATGYKTESILCMPIVDKDGAAIGVTQVLNKSGGEFLARDEARLKAFTAQVSISLANAQIGRAHV